MNYHVDATVLKMNERWHIPRASLSGSHTSSSGRSVGSSISDISSLREFQVRRPPEGLHTCAGSKQENRLRELQTRFGDSTRRQNSAEIPKRGSRSSQGSSDSNQSTQSASSGSLLLTVANLEEFTRKTPTCLPPPSGRSSASRYFANITLPPTLEDVNPQLEGRTKDLDAVSMASSTHFTVVNGMGGQQHIAKSGFCKRGHQITILILSMSFVFLIGILAAVFLLEMRARDMPK
ncbi:uncharacterized protein LOC132260212 [Phlebotomus argentipes]|uniref:uncharacterized protein LOC132260212 n=1 Tax=Phlebotomus argentipes TaxID=94469 RepID=UPI00289350A3|nr:uncharacterized protein LOC132260212 [Phlebotomus argentipes]